MSGQTISAAKLLIGLGLIGNELQATGKPLTRLRAVLTRHGFTSNEISIIFDTLRHERIRGLQVRIRQEGTSYVWSLSGVNVEP